MFDPRQPQQPPPPQGQQPPQGQGQGWGQQFWGPILARLQAQRMGQGQGRPMWGGPQGQDRPGFRPEEHMGQGPGPRQFMQPNPNMPPRPGIQALPRDLGDGDGQQHMPPMFNRAQPQPQLQAGIQQDQNDIERQQAIQAQRGY